MSVLTSPVANNVLKIISLHAEPVGSIKALLKPGDRYTLYNDFKHHRRQRIRLIVNLCSTSQSKTHFIIRASK